MVIRKIDNRIRTLIENGVETGHRSIFLIIGEKAKDQVVVLHSILTKSQVKARPTVLWCYKKELGFNNNRKKRLKRLNKKIFSGVNVSNENPFDLFVDSTSIRFTYYKETTNILGNTFGMLVLQDFEALTPNIMARTIETIEGGGVICFLLSTLSSLKQLQTLTMDVHSRYRTESHQDIVPRFNERFILSIFDCSMSLIIDDQLNIIPLSSQNLNITKIYKKNMDDALTENEIKLKDLCDSLSDTQPLGALLPCCKTFDQGNTLCKFLEIFSSPNIHSVVSLTAARGRGKSALLGLAISGAVALGMSNIFVTAPTPENLITLFKFVLKGLSLLGYTEHIDYESTEKTINNIKCIVHIHVSRNHLQNIRYVDPCNSKNINNAELVICDEAAAIPLPIVKGFIGPHILVLSSTINGYEGTGRSLSLKLLHDLRSNSDSTTQQHQSALQNTLKSQPNSSKSLVELTLNESIRYREGDVVEKWLNKLLCLDICEIPVINNSFVSSASQCQLYYVSRDTLFSYHRVAESFLQNMVCLYVSSHYKNSPNDLQMIADAPAHHLFVLLASNQSKENAISNILCVIQVCLEGNISESTVNQNMGRGQRASGDLIPWTISQQFCESDFALLFGARIVRIATHPDYMQLGYGTRAMELLLDYYENSHNETQSSPAPLKNSHANIDIVEPTSGLPPLLIKLEDRAAERLDYIGVSYGITPRLLKFWKRLKFVPVYVRQTTSELTGEHTCIMLRTINKNQSLESTHWLKSYFNDFRCRFISLLGSCFCNVSPPVALSILYNDVISIETKPLNDTELDLIFAPHDIKRLELYSKNMIDYHLILDLVPKVSLLFFNQRLNIESNNWLQLSILLSIGLQHKSLDEAEKILNMPASQILALFNKIILKTINVLSVIKENTILPTIISVKSKYEPQEHVSNEKSTNEKSEVKLTPHLNKYAINNDKKIWDNAVKTSSSIPTSISIPRLKVKKSKKN